MSPNYDFEKLFHVFLESKDALVVNPLVEPVRISKQEMDELLVRYRGFKQDFPGLAFWVIFDIYKWDILEGGGFEDVFGVRVDSLRQFLKLVHPDYLEPYLRWGAAAYQLTVRRKGEIAPMATSYRVSIPMCLKNGVYHWFSQHVTVVQVDAEGKLVAHLNTYYKEGLWSPYNLRPFEACLSSNASPEDAHLEKRLYAQMAPYILDVFTNNELELLSLYVSGAEQETILKNLRWTKNTLHEYNANILRKAKKLFQFDFRSAKGFAAYCKERGFIIPR